MASPFQKWLKGMKTCNGGKKTTLEQEFELAFGLYQQAYLSNDQNQTVDQVIKMVENTPIHDPSSIVSWTGIKVDWFLNVFCKSPFMKVLIDFGCEVWFIRKICVIEMVRQTSASELQEKPNGTFVENIHSVVKGWGLEAGQDVTAKPTRFVSYTGSYTMKHVVKVLSNLDPQEYIWMDIFCVNQFAWTGKGRTPEMRHFRNAFMDDLQNQIQAIGNTALVLEKWDNLMLTLGQMWVLWEIFNTAQAGVGLKVLLTPEQRDSFIANCLESAKEFASIQASLATIDANNAVTDDDIDRQFILQRMQREDNNLVRINTAILEVMRNWLCEEGLEHLSQIRGSRKRPSGSMLNNLGLLLRDQGRLDEAEPLLREALEPSTYTINSINSLATLLYSQGKMNEAEPLFREALAISQQVLGPRHPDTLGSINNLGGLLFSQGNLNEAEPLLREALETSRHVLGDSHPDTLGSINNLGFLLQAQRNLDEAESLFREALATSRQVLGPRHPDTLSIINNLGGLLYTQGNLNEAEPLFREALANSRQVLGSRHPDTLGSINNLGFLLQEQGNLNEAEPLLREALKIKQQVLGDQHPGTLTSMSNMGLLLQAQGNLNEAGSLFREALATSREVLGPSHPDTLTFTNNLGSLLEAQGKLNQAEPL